MKFYKILVSCTLEKKYEKYAKCRLPLCDLRKSYDSWDFSTRFIQYTGSWIYPKIAF